MTLDADIVADMVESWAAWKRGKDLAFAVFPPKRASDPPWLLVDRAGPLRARVQAAAKTAGTRGFVKANLVEGRVIVEDGRTVLVLPDEDAGLERQVRGKWSTALRAEPDRDLQRLGVALRAVVVTSEAGLPTLPPVPVVAPKVKSAFASLRAKLGALSRPEKGREKPQHTALWGAVLAVRPTEVRKAVPAFLRMAIGAPPRDSAPRRVGDRLPPEDQALGTASSMNAWLRAKNAWEPLLDRATTLQADHDRDPSPELVAAYMEARLASARAGELAEKLRQQVEAELADLQREVS